MTHAEYHSITKVLLDRCFAIQTAKRREYTAEDVDVLLNFKETANYIGVFPNFVWGTFFMKGVKALMTIMADTYLDRPATSAEPPLDRFADTVNYALLGYALYVESVDEKKRRGSSAMAARAEQAGCPQKAASFFREGKSEPKSNLSEAPRQNCQEDEGIPPKEKVLPFTGGVRDTPQEAE